MRAGVSSVATIPVPFPQGSRHRVGALPSDSFRRLRGYYGPVRLLARPRRLGCRLVRRVAVAIRAPRGLPCSTRSCHRVPSLLPRRGTSVHRLSTFPRRAAFAHFVEARPPMFFRGYVWVRCALRPVVLQPPACQLAAYWSRFCWTPHGVTQGTALPYCSAIHRGGLLSSHKERAALHGAHKVVLVSCYRDSGNNSLE